MSLIKLLTRYLESSRFLILSLSLLVGILMVSSVPVFAGGAPRLSQQARYLEITEIQGSVFYEREGLKAEARPAKVGDRLSRSGEGIRTGSNSNARVNLDNGIGNISVAQNTNLKVDSLRTLRNGAKTTDLAMTRGQNRFQVRSFTNPQSRFNVKTPSGVAGVRGTEFVVTVLPEGETRVDTLEGAVAVSAQNQTQQVTGGYFSRIAPGQPPTPPQPRAEISPTEAPTSLNQNLGNLRVSLELLPAPDNDQVRVTGKVNPMNSVFLNDEAVNLGPTGEFNAIATIPNNRRLRLVVRTPLAEAQVYELIVP